MFASIVPLLFKNRKIVIYGGIVFAIVLASFIAYKHYTGLLSTITRLETDRTTLSTAVETQDKTIDQVLEALKEQQVAIEVYEDELARVAGVTERSRNETRRLQAQLRNLDLERLLAEEPEDAGDVAGREYASSIRLLECAAANRSADCADRTASNTKAQPPKAGASELTE